MPFVVRCPHTGCQKYMLVEDEMRGMTVKCLVCGQMLQVDATPTPPLRERADNATTAEKSVRTCPHCQTKLRVPATARQVRCPKCGGTF